MKFRNPHTLWSLICLVTIVLFASCDDPIAPPEGSIPIEEAIMLQNNYKETRAGVLEEALGFEDTRDFWFSLNTVKEYIEYVEEQAAIQGVSNLGLRVHFAAYPTQGDYPDPGYATVFFIPTTQVDPPIGGAKGFAPLPPQNVVLDSVNALNYGNGGIPPNDIE